MCARRKKHSRTQHLSTILILGFLAALVFFVLKRNQQQKIHFTRYKAFGIAIPDGFKIHGIDVSRYQQVIGWEEVKKMNVSNIKINFVFIKATEGESLTDPYFKRNWQQAQKHKLVRGAYHFFLPDRSAAGQVRQYLNQVKLQPGDLPPVLDIEHTRGIAPKLLKANVLFWLRTIEKHYLVKPIIYTNAAFYEKYLGKEFDDYPLWVAHYYEPHQPRIQRDWFFWQHNDRGNVNGIDHKVDFNVFNGDSLEFHDLLIK